MQTIVIEFADVHAQVRKRERERTMELKRHKRVSDWPGDEAEGVGPRGSWRLRTSVGLCSAGEEIANVMSIRRTDTQAEFGLKYRPKVSP
ncbi:hypothetical protein HNR59_002022 [Aquamicrobium lusatiense]|uniref:Uncharacterized protein n=1 Tax=Aquamicrobium lusatiense TaxID=89772 RepID=A0A7W9VW22_9HYPH|nr:hypothetical protein [Aquamicrobium lusatiense]MBB6012677.1 hypothetical protein [Aquamicrobium lusatiense]